MANSGSLLLFVFFWTGISLSVNTQYYYDHWCGPCSYCLTYLDDSQCQKVFPSNFSRGWSCPNEITTDRIPDGYSEATDLENVVVQTNGLVNIPSTANVNMAVILVKRIRVNGQSKVVYKYLSNGNKHLTTFEPWSSTKVFAATNAAGRMRENGCETGIDSYTNGKRGETHLGDLVTIFASYDETIGYSSNGVSAYFHNIGNRKRALSLVTEWLGRRSESFGGNYGESVPSDLGYTFYPRVASENSRDGNENENENENETENENENENENEREKEKKRRSCRITPDTTSGIQNNLSTLSLAEMMKRLVLHRDHPSQFQFPNITWADAEEILYGSKKSKFFNGLTFGGISADTSVFVQSGLDMSQVEGRSQGNWRIFSKFGAGYSSSRRVGEIVNVAYLCLPVEQGEGAIEQGVEAIISVRSSVSGDSKLTQAEKLVQIATADVVNAIYFNRL